MAKRKRDVCKPVRYVFKDTEEIRLYLQCLLEMSGPVHAVMGMLRSLFGARTYQIQHLMRKHLDLGKKESKIYLLPMKGYDGEWVALPSNMHDLLKKAATAGVDGKVFRKNGRRPASSVDVGFKLSGGSVGTGSLESQNDYVFKPAFSGRYDVIVLQ